jgi:RimJ/RimL family protein N-acetyltransferase
MRVVPYDHDHLPALQLQPAQWEVAAPTMSELTALKDAGDAYTALADDGTVLGIFGCFQLWPGRAHGWALVSQHAGPHMRRITREILRYLAASPFRRIEAHVDANFSAAIRWAHVLGFACETPRPMQGFTPDGRACYLFALTREGEDG